MMNESHSISPYGLVNKNVCLQAEQREAQAQLERLNNINQELMHRKTEIEWQLVEAVALVSNALALELLTDACDSCWASSSHCAASAAASLELATV